MRRLQLWIELRERVSIAAGVAGSMARECRRPFLGDVSHRNVLDYVQKFEASVTVAFELAYAIRNELEVHDCNVLRIGRRTEAAILQKTLEQLHDSKELFCGDALKADAVEKRMNTACRNAYDVVEVICGNPPLYARP